MENAVSNPVLKMGDARLLRRAQVVDTFNTPALDALIASLWATMAAEGGVGLAAPQIGVDLRIIVFGFAESARYPDAEAVPLTVLINPELTPLSTEEVEAWEGCLSVPGLRGLVPRWQKLRYRGFSPCGERIEREVDGFHARVVQHEADHLDGILYPRRIRDLSQFGFTDVLFPELS